jgi:hypothetical protein
MTVAFAEIVAASAANVRFTDVDVRSMSSHSVNGRNVKMWGGVEAFRDYDGVVFAASLRGDVNAPLHEALDAAEREQPPDAFLNTVFAVAGSSDPALLSGVARLGGIIVSSPRDSGDPTRQAHALGERVAKVVEWVRHARSHEHGQAHGHSHHHA